MAAIRDGNCSKLAVILNSNHGAAAVRTPFGTWLHVAAKHGQLEIVRMLVEEYGLDVNAPDKMSKGSPVNSAARNGHCEVTEYLLDKGAVLDTSDSVRNPLFGTILGCNIEVAKLLIDRGIDTSVRYSGDVMQNVDALEFANSRGATEFVALLEEEKKKHEMKPAAGKPNEQVESDLKSNSTNATPSRSRQIGLDLANGNWLIFQNESDSDFGELVSTGLTLFRRSGKLFSFGKSERTDFVDQDQLSRAFKRASAAFLNDEMKIVRQWNFDPDFFDFELLKNELIDAVRLAVSETRIGSPNVNAFALYTDHDASTITLTCHAHESFADADIEELFNPSAWSLWYRGPLFAPTYRLILSQNRDGMSPEDFLAYKAGFKKACVTALETLDEDGLFGDRNSRLLMYVVCDSDQDDDLIRKFNTAEIFQRWQAWA